MRFGDGLRMDPVNYIWEKRAQVYGLSEMLVRRRLFLLDRFLSGYGMMLSISLVKSSENKADILTRVPSSWFKHEKCMMLASPRKVLTMEEVKAIHAIHHFGVNRTLFAVKKICGTADESLVTKVVAECTQCLSIDPCAVRWPRGELEVTRTWQRLACDITHFGGEIFFTSIDCGPSRFAIWKRVENESANIIAELLVEIFRERGPPDELLCDNGKSFRSQAVQELCRAWNVSMIYRCAYRQETVSSRETIVLLKGWLRDLGEMC